MGFKEGDEVQSKRDLKNCGAMRLGRVGRGKVGIVYKVTWSGKYHVRFEDGTKCENLTDEDIRGKGFFS